MALVFTDFQLGIIILSQHQKKQDALSAHFGCRGILVTVTTAAVSKIFNIIYFVWVESWKFTQKGLETSASIWCDVNVRSIHKLFHKMLWFCSRHLTALPIITTQLILPEHLAFATNWTPCEEYVHCCVYMTWHVGLMISRESYNMSMHHEFSSYLIIFTSVTIFLTWMEPVRICWLTLCFKRFPFL